jgi:hypothetical protein
MLPVPISVFGESTWRTQAATALARYAHAQTTPRLDPFSSWELRAPLNRSTWASNPPKPCLFNSKPVASQSLGDFFIALGGEYVRNQYFRQYWDGRLVTGVFHPQTAVRGAELLRKRVHFLGFVNEEEFGPDAFARSTDFVANPGSFAKVEEMRAAIDAWPLQPTIVLNGE